MKRILFLLSAIVISITTMAQAPAFPGAEGTARWTTTGGRGGQVIHVTTLADSGTGSLRAALAQSGARIIVFDVSGVIELKSRLTITRGSVTIEGQTAPGDGICLKGNSLYINASNVIVRYLRCRMGDIDETLDDDAMSASHHDDAKRSNIIIDHCSMSWCTDECGSFYGNTNFTLQWCMLSESLKYSEAKGKNHGYGGIWGGVNAAFVHNMLAHHDSRNPRFDHDYVSTMKGPIDYVNNVVYNWGSNSTYGGESANTNNEYRKINMVNNYYKPGPATNSGVKSRLAYFWTECDNCKNAMSCSTIVPAHVYLYGNYMYGSSSVTTDNWSGITLQSGDKTSIKEAASYVPEGYEAKTYINTHSAENAYNKVLDFVGASYKRDVIDQRIVKEAEEGTYTYIGSHNSGKGIIDSQEDVGGWPTYVSKDKLTDSDNDGMPDVWETANGLNPNDASDATTYSLDSKGWYTNIEVYCNSLVEDMVKAQMGDAVNAIDEYYPAVAKAEGVPYYDGSTAEGGYEKPDGAQGNILWQLNSNTNAEVGSAIADYIETTAFETGANISTNGNGTYNNIRFTKFTAANPVSEPTEDDAVTFSFTTKSGFQFQATEIQVTACKIGTDNGNFNATWTDGGGTKTIVEGAAPARNNADNGYYTTYNWDMNTMAKATDGTCRLTIYPYNVGFIKEGTITQKDMGFANVIINGTIVNPSTGISTPVTVTLPVSMEYFNLSGQRVNASAKGIIIEKQRMADGKTIVKKIAR